MKLFLSALIAFLALSYGQDVQAGGDIGYSKSDYVAYSRCRFVEDADELVNYSSRRALKAEVYTRYEHAADVANSDRAVYSQSPLYVWASHAKISCAKSYGYLKMRRKWKRRPDYEMLQRCECFYERMLAYLGR